MPLLFSLLLWVFPLLLFVPVGVLFIECVAAVFPERSQRYGDRRTRDPATRPRVAVLIPAHNEEFCIQETLRTIAPQLGAQDGLIVIADNCTDQTAAIAREAGATVIERENAVERGKGYALDYGLQQLDADPPDVVVMVDADCNVHLSCISKISQLAWIKNRPVQALYLMEQPPRPTPRDSISALAFLFKNLVRPTGLYQLYQPCLLTGTGMAFPWEIIRNSPLASGNIVEDMQLGLDLAIAGYPPLFCRQARVTGRLPSQDKAATSQRTRWEHGHLRTLLTQSPRLIQAGIKQRRFGLVAIALDLFVPPLSLLVMLWIVGTLVTAAGAFLGASIVPFAVMILQGLLVLIAIYIGWFSFGQQEIPLMALLSVPLYVLWKIPIYFKFLIRPQQKWVRTERETSTDTSKV